MRSLERLDPLLAERVRADTRRMPSWGVTFVAPGGRSLRVPFTRAIGQGEAPGAIMPRLDFDDIPFRKVKATPGITVLEGTTAKTFERTEEGWAVGSLHSARSDHQATTDQSRSTADPAFAAPMAKAVNPSANPMGRQDACLTTDQ